MKRYDRQVRLKEIGKKGQVKLSRSNICIIGAGGIGSQLLPILVGAGLGKITIVDFDDVAISNLHRQTLYRENQVGKNKALSAKESLENLNSAVELNVLPEKLTEKTAQILFTDSDLILDATDNFDTKFLINKIAAQTQKPLIYASVRRFEGQVAYLQPHKGYGLQSFIKKPNEQQAQSEYEDGVLPSQVSIIAALQAQIAIGFIVGGKLMPKLGELIIFDGLRFYMQKLMIPQIPLK